MRTIRHDLLDGVSVVEAGHGDAVAYAGRLLADAGAAVVKLRSADEASSAWSAALDDGKTVVAPADPTARAAFAEARVVLLGDGEQSAAPPLGDGTIVVRVTPWGASDDRPAHDLTLQAAAGICAGIGVRGKPPLKLPLDQSAFQGGVVAAIAAAASLLSVKGADIDVAIAEVWAAFYSGLEVANARFGRSRTSRAGHRTRGVPWPRTLMRCKDGYFAVQCATRDHWQRFLALVGRPELETAPLFADRIKANDLHGDEAEATFADWFGARTKAELTAAFLEARLPGAPVLEIAEIAEHPHLRSRQALQPVTLGDGKIALALNPPYRTIATGRATPPETTNADPAQPLAGIRVVDFGWVWAGAVPGHILADLGAEVIKVESGARLDYMRQGRPIVGKERSPEQNPMHQCVNRGKLSLNIDMTNQRGAELLRRLVAKSDIVIENFTPGVLDRSGLGWKALSEVRPGLILCSMSAAGSSGPLRDVRTYATMIAGLAGLDAMVRYPGGRVLGSQSSYADPNASLHAAFAILAALYRRRRRGEGCWIDLSQWEAGAAMVGEALAEQSATGAFDRACVSAVGRAPHGVYPALGEDRWIAISAAGGADWRALAEELGSPEWMAAELHPISASTALDERLAKETARFDAGDLARRLRARSVAAAPVQAPGALLNDPDFRDAELFQEVEHPILGAVPIYRLPWRLNGARHPVRRRAPLLGEHNDYILGELLGLSAEERKTLDAEGIFA